MSLVSSQGVEALSYLGEWNQRLRYQWHLLELEAAGERKDDRWMLNDIGRLVHYLPWECRSVFLSLHVRTSLRVVQRLNDIQQNLGGYKIWRELNLATLAPIAKPPN